MPKENQCLVCTNPIDNVEHYAINEEGIIVTICDTCYNNLKIFFPKNRG